MRAKQRLAGYKEINTPELLDKTLMGKIWSLGKIW
jgi:threonyl-tRNA synthetase